MKTIVPNKFFICLIFVNSKFEEYIFNRVFFRIPSVFDVLYILNIPIFLAVLDEVRKKNLELFGGLIHNIGPLLWRIPHKI